MSQKSPNRRTHPGAAIVCSLTLLAITGGQVFADPGCKKVQGKIAIQAVTGPACLSPVGLCLSGNLVGTLHGAFTFTASAIIPTADTPLTGVVFSTGDSTLETAGGTLFTKDALALNPSPPGEFSDLSVITGGTGDWSGAYGSLTITGAYTSGQGEAVYSGEACTP